MVISFSADPAFDHLKETGGVVTFRSELRTKTPSDGVQETWANRGRGKEKEFDVYVVEIGPYDGDDAMFAILWPLSGFRSPRHWRDRVVDYHGEVPDSGYFYLVMRSDHDKASAMEVAQGLRDVSDRPAGGDE